MTKCFAAEFSSAVPSRRGVPRRLTAGEQLAAAGGEKQSRSATPAELAPELLPRTRRARYRAEASAWRLRTSRRLRYRRCLARTRSRYPRARHASVQ
jgi:hypothetical protein